MSTAERSAPPKASDVDPRALQRFLDGPHPAARDLVREWLSEPGHAPRDDMERDEHRRQVLEWALSLAARGGTAVGFPSAYGGQDDVGSSVAGFETLAFGDLSVLVKCGVQFGLWGGAILHLGTQKHHDAYLREIAAGELLGCFAMTETGHGSNVHALGTTATFDEATEEWVLQTPDASARKDYIGNAARDGRMAAVFAQLTTKREEQGVHAFVIPIRDEDGEAMPGVTIEDCGAKLGLDGVDNGRLMFDGVRVPREALLDRYAQVAPDGSYSSPIENPSKRFFTMLGTLIQGRVSVCGAAVNAAKVAEVIAVRHGETRRQFGPPGEPEVVLMDYRVHQRKLLPAIATTYALHFAQEEMVEQLHRIFTGVDTDDRHRRELETTAAGLKAIATWHTTDTVQLCREACGGAGYLRGNRFAALKADTDVFTTFEGDNTVLLQLTAKNLLTDYKDHFGELDPLGVASFLTGQVIGGVTERTGLREILGRLGDDLIPGRDSDENLLDRATQRDMFKWRAEHLLGGAARRLKGGMDKGFDPFDVLVEVQDHVILAGRAHIDQLVLEAFARAVERCEDPAQKALLDRLCSLHALWLVERDRGYYQEHGRLSSTRSKAVLKAVNALCRELRPDADTLVEAFGVPEAALGDAQRVTQAGDDPVESEPAGATA